VASSLTQQLLKISVEVYGCDAECTANSFEGMIFDPEVVMEKCGCTNPISFDMSTQLLFKSPDMELFRFMKVDTSDYEIDLLALDEMKKDLTIMPQMPK